MKTYLFGHTSFETAYKVENYPYGFKLRTTLYCWIETHPKKGDRYCTCTINPKNGRINATKCSTYMNIKVLYLDEQGYVHGNGVYIYMDRKEIAAFGEAVGLENLNADQMKQYRQLMGINEVKTNEFTGEKIKDFSIAWTKDHRHEGKYRELKITFDRPDGVQVREMLNAMRTVNQEKLNQVFEMREYGQWGESCGTVRICTRGGNQLCTVDEESYREFLAMDETILNSEEAA